MTTIRLKLLTAGIILAGAVGYLSFAGVRSGWVYFTDVDKFLSDPQLRTQRIRVHGTVSTDNFEMSPARLTASFRLTGKVSELPVVYHGNIPELFGAGKNVVVEGRCDVDGVFQADVLMTKCASKYEPGSPHAADGASPSAEKKP